MSGNKKWNSDLDLLGKMKISTVPNNTGTVLTYNNSTKEISTRTNSQIIDDLGLITVTNSPYALVNGTNASGTWANSSNGLENNPTIAGKTMLGNTTSSLQNANNGTIAGYLNSFGTAAGNPSDDWWYRLKMLHPNTAGFNGEIAVQMTGSLSMMYRRMESGAESGWIKTLDEATNSFISGMNSYRTTGNQYDSMALHAYSDTAASPAIAFHKSGVYAGSIAMVSGTMYQFRDLAGTGLVNTQVSISHATNGFVHTNVNSADSVLTSDGGVADLDIDIINDSGSLVIQDYFEKFDVNNTFDGSVNPNKLVYLIGKGYNIYLENLRPGQRIVLMNPQPSDDIYIHVDSNLIYTLARKRKVTFYVETYSDIHVFDDSEYFYYTP